MTMGTPGRIPPALATTAGTRPPLETWDPNGDILIPEMQAEIAYAPPIVVAPPQLPTPDQHPQRKDFPARGIRAFFDTAQADRNFSSLGFVAHSVQVDNLSNQWLWFPSARRFMPPAMFGFILQIVDGTEVAEWHVMLPAGHAVGTIGTAAGPVTTVWYEDYLPACNGVAVTV